MTELPENWIPHNCKHSKDYDVKCFLVLRKPNKKLRNALKKGLKL